MIAAADAEVAPAPAWEAASGLKEEPSALLPTAMLTKLAGGLGTALQLQGLRLLLFGLQRYTATNAVPEQVFCN